MDEYKIMKKALDFYCQSVIEGIPLRWREGAIESIVKEKQDEPTERIKQLIKLVIDETKNELSQ